MAKPKWNLEGLGQVAYANGRTYTSQNLIDWRKATPRQLQWWDEHGLVLPRREGHKRVYTPEDFVQVCLISQLKRKGLSLREASKAISFARRKLCELISDGKSFYFLTDGEFCWLEESENRVIEIIRKFDRPMNLVRIARMAYMSDL